MHSLHIPGAEPIIDIVCGQDHTLFLDKSGQVFACGWGADGQLGNGVFDSNSTPSKVLGDIQGERIVSLSSACDTILAVNGKILFEFLFLKIVCNILIDFSNFYLNFIFNRQR